KLTLRSPQLVVINLSGRGDKDVTEVMRLMSGELEKIPLLAEEGWREAPEWSVRRQRYRQSDHAVCAGSVALRLFFIGAATLEASPYRARASRPPLRGGECMTRIEKRFAQLKSDGGKAFIPYVTA